jgi:DNA-directed RNA polymerase subunit RPC12/RpoP
MTIYKCRHCGKTNPIPPETRPASSPERKRRPGSVIRLMACRHCGANNRVKVPYAD